MGGTESALSGACVGLHERVLFIIAYLPESPQWLPAAARGMEPQLPPSAHSALRVCPTSRLLHTLFSPPVTLGPGLPTTQLC